MSCAAAVAVLDCLLTQEVPFAYPDCPQSWVVKQPQPIDLVLMNENRCRALSSCRPPANPLSATLAASTTHSRSIRTGAIGPSPLSDGARTGHGNGRQLSTSCKSRDLLR
jgi:hypothetical protein